MLQAESKTYDSLAFSRYCPELDLYFELLNPKSNLDTTDYLLEIP